MVGIFEKIVDLIKIASQGHEMLQIRFQEIKKALKSVLFFSWFKDEIEGQ